LNQLLEKFSEKNIDFKISLGINKIDGYYNKFKNNENFNDFWSSLFDLYKENSCKL